MVKGVYETGLTQNKEEIHGERTYTERDIQREDVHGEETYTERGQTRSGYIQGVGTDKERGHMGKGHTWRGDTHRKGTHRGGIHMGKIHT